MKKTKRAEMCYILPFNPHQGFIQNPDGNPELLFVALDSDDESILVIGDNRDESA